MKTIKLFGLLFCLVIMVYGQNQKGESKKLTLKNSEITCEVLLKDKILESDLIYFSNKKDADEIKTDADFGIEFHWTDWRAPGMKSNGMQHIRFDKNSFEFIKSEKYSEEKSKFLELYFKSKLYSSFYEEDVNNIVVKLTYKITEGENYLRRKLSVADTVYAKHFVHLIDARAGKVFGDWEIVKEGEFGQPAVIKNSKNGGFFGVEYPTAVNTINKYENSLKLKCSQLFGQKIDSNWIETAWVVSGITPDNRTKYWFMEYVKGIRVAPANPYTLYNSWYDLRSVEYARVPESNWMNEKNVLKMVNLVKENFIEKHNIHLDAFVLDDGWDIYESDWKLRDKQFPRGMKPIADELEKTNTDLGIWFGPTGGYSYRSKRIDWMKENGYEVVGNEVHWHSSMLCLGGTNYSNLFRKRTVDFVKDDNVKYFKWDGIQFSCSEPDHGHPIGFYSRRAVMESVIDKCAAVRKANPDVYLNITSGTWLSPWWVKYANQIWMDGEDYGYADVPSISKRDGAITYRDFVLYEDFHNKDLWFPIANLMTHGIIKGNLQMLGGKKEPLDKFTDNALFYFGRGVSMWELYISPDILTDDEWDAIGESSHWAKHNFETLSNTFMIGGNPMKSEAYGYTHLKGKKGIVALRNPIIEKQSIEVELSYEQGLDKNAENLVVERVYPTRWISSKLYKTGDKIDIKLGGYETAVYEIYPLDQAVEPLISNTVFELNKINNSDYSFNLLSVTGEIKLLNPEKVENIKLEGNIVKLENIEPELNNNDDLFENIDCKITDNNLFVNLTVLEDVKNAEFALLIKPENKGVKLPEAQFKLNGKSAEAENQAGKGVWKWYTLPIKKGNNKIEVVLNSDSENTNFNLSLWFSGQQKQLTKEIKISTNMKQTKRILPPKPWGSGIIRKYKHIKDFDLK